MIILEASVELILQSVGGDDSSAELSISSGFDSIFDSRSSASTLFSFAFSLFGVSELVL